MMTCRRVTPAMRGLRASTLLLFGVVLIQLLADERVHAQRSKATSPWQTLNGDAPLVIARGGFSGMLPDSSSAAYNLAIMTSVSNVVLWCDVQLTKDGVGICFPNVNLGNASTIQNVYPKRQNSYLVNGVPTQGWFSIDFTLKELGKVFLNQGIYSRTFRFDGNGYSIMTVQDVETQLKPPGFWLNIQHDMFYSQHNLSMSRFVLSVLKSGVVNFISSPEVNFLRGIASSKPKATKLVFRFLGQEDVEPSTNQTYGSLLRNLTSIKAFASGILVPKSYIWPVDPSLYLLPHTSLVQDAHKAGLEVYASDFANDFVFAYNYSYDPVAEYLSFMDNGDFSVDGVLSDFPITASEAVDCFSHLGRNATKQVDVLVITKNGASGDYPGCTDLAYQKAIRDGADVIDCSVQMSKDGIPFCLSSIDLGNSTMIAQSPFINRSTTVPEISATPGIYAFSLTWSEIQTLKPAISNPFQSYRLYRNPKNKDAGKLVNLADFLSLAKNASTLTGVLISVEYAPYLAEKQGLGVVDAVLGALADAGYNKTTQKVMIQSTNSSVLVEFKEKSSYRTVYKIEEGIRDVQVSAAGDIKKFANSVVIEKTSVIPDSDQFITGQTDVVSKLQTSQLPVYVGTLHNEFVSQAWDFFSDATVEINSFVLGVGVNGTVTDFPQTAARYRRNRCLGRKIPPPYMTPVKPGALLGLIGSPQLLPPAEAPNPVFTESDVSEPPLPPVTARAPTTSPGNSSTTAAQPPSGQSRVSSSRLSTTFAMLLLAYLLLL